MYYIMTKYFFVKHLPALIFFNLIFYEFTLIYLFLSEFSPKLMHYINIYLIIINL